MAENEIIKPRIVTHWHSSRSALLRTDLSSSAVAKVIASEADRWLGKKLKELTDAGLSFQQLIKGGQQTLFPSGPMPVAGYPDVDFADMVVTASQTCQGGLQRQKLEAVADHLSVIACEEMLMLASSKPLYTAAEARSELARALWPELTAQRERAIRRMLCAITGVPFKGEKKLSPSALLAAPTASQLVSFSLRTTAGAGPRDHAHR